jgi:hypothetical protein
MTRHEVKCINKSERYDPHDRIRTLGGVNAGGTRWCLPQEHAIASMESKEFEFFVRVQGHEVAVVVAESRYGHKYLKTKADGEQPNNLLLLPECP